MSHAPWVTSVQRLVTTNVPLELPALQVPSSRVVERGASNRTIVAHVSAPLALNSVPETDQVPLLTGRNGRLADADIEPSPLRVIAIVEDAWFRPSAP